MKLTVERAAASAALSRVAGLVMRSTTIPILSTIAMKANGALSLTATDLDTWATVRVDGDIEQTGEIAAPAATLADALSKSDGQTAEISLAGGRLGLKIGRASFKMPTQTTADFPLARPDSLVECGQIGSRDLRAMIDTTIYAASRDAGRFHLNGVHLSNHGDGVRCIGLDGGQLALRDHSGAFAPFAAVTLPLKALACLGKFMGDDEPVRVLLSDRMVQFVTASGELTTKVIDGQFPDCTYPLSRVVEVSATVDSAELSGAVKRALVIANDGERSVRLDLKDGVLAVTTRDRETGESSEEIETGSHEGEGGVSLSGARLLSTLAACDAETVDIGFTAESMIVRPTAGTDRMFVITTFRSGRQIAPT